MKFAIISGTTAPCGGPRHIYSLLENLDHNEWNVVVCTHQDGYYWDKFVALGITPYDLILRHEEVDIDLSLKKSAAIIKYSILNWSGVLNLSRCA